MAQRVLKANGNVVPRRSVRPLATAEIESETEKNKRKHFTELITSRWGSSFTPPPSKSEVNPENLDFGEYGDEECKIAYNYHTCCNFFYTLNRRSEL